MNSHAALPPVDLLRKLPLEEQLVGVNAKTGPYLMPDAGKSLRRVKGFQSQTNTFHVMSRTCGGAVFWDDVEKEALRRVLWRLAEFCGVRLLTYCVMGNHFHALVEVPDQKRWVEEQFGGPQGEQKLMRHLRVLYSKVFVEQLQEDFAELRKRGSEAVVQHRLGLLKKRFCDVAVYMREVKQRFSRWYNKRHKRKGTLWMDRFRSVLVEGKGDPLLAMAAFYAGMLTKVGVYVLLRVFVTVFPPATPWIGELLAWGAGATMVLGVLGAVSRDRVQHILAYHILSQIGFMVLAIGFGTPLAITAAILYIMHHIVVKAALFLVGGAIQHRCGHDRLDDAGGLMRAAPWLATGFLLQALSLAGLPPLTS